MIVGVPKETVAGERRVALIPAQVPELRKAKLEVLVERGAGTAADFADTQYEARGAALGTRADVATRANVLLHVRAHGGAGLPAGPHGQVRIGLFDPYDAAREIAECARQGATCFGLELLPRVTRAQPMDVLSSMATLAGYKAVVLAAEALPRIFPMLMTAAGTLAPARVLVVGTGVAGLQAIATARRLGAVCQAYDVRPSAKEQVLSVGARFVELDLDTRNTEDQGGYAREQSEAFLERQRAELTKVVQAHDIVITTASVPGKRAPSIISEEMVRAMHPGSVIVDLAADRGGNCALTEAGRTVTAYGVTIIGAQSLASTIPYHASQMYSKNITSFLLSLVTDGQVVIDAANEIAAATLLTRNGEVVSPLVRQTLGLAERSTRIGSGA